jgi:hypothetical protein
MAEEDEIIKKTRTWVKVGGIISGGLVTILTPLIIMYVEIKPQVDEAKTGAESSIDGIIPAIVEMQSILDDNGEWASEVNEDLDIALNSVDEMNEMDKRLIRCETYMDLLAQRRSFPRAPDPIEEEDPDLVASMFPPDKPEPRRAQVQQKAQYQVPKNFKNAKAAGKARHKAKCAPDDPLCGGF